MADAIRAEIARKLFVDYGLCLFRVKRRIRGVRITHIPHVHIIGGFVGGVVLGDLVEMGDESPQAVFMRLKRLISAGLVCKDGKRYKLTDRGRMVYDDINKEFEPHLAEILKLTASLL